jgi:hypothetical protein
MELIIMGNKEFTPYAVGKWHVWQGVSSVLLSDENTKTLRAFKDIDACINWLYLYSDKEAARAIALHVS